MRRWMSTPEPPEPWCLIGKISWGVVTACKVPESRAEYYVTHHGFTILIRDSEFPVVTYEPWEMPVQSNPKRYDDPPDYA